MAQNGSQILNVRLQTSLVEKARLKGAEKGMTVSEFIRVALVTYLESDPIYEIVKTRAVMLQVMHTQMPEDQVVELLTQAEKVAKQYLKEQFGKVNATP